jgi:lipoprotein-anchoring transpeptidase ErfK/SrfK
MRRWRPPLLVPVSPTFQLAVTSVTFCLADARLVQSALPKVPSSDEAPRTKAPVRRGNTVMKSVLAAALAALALSAAPVAAQQQFASLDVSPNYDLLYNPPRAERQAARTIPREMVAYAGPERPGTIIVSTDERRLYLVLGNGRAPCATASASAATASTWTRHVKTVTRMAEWPDWRPPAEMIARRPDLPRFMPGGPANPLGARALYLGSSLYRIHGSNEPHTIGQAVSVRLHPHDQRGRHRPLQRVRVGATVVDCRDAPCPPWTHRAYARRPTASKPVTA